MDYNKVINYLFSQLPMFEKQGTTGFNEGLRNTLALDAHYEHPHLRYPTLHVAGTNGKGSCAHSLAAVLQECGYRVGLYTSPHLVDFRERIRVNGEMISEDYVVDFVERGRSFFEPLRPSFFELTTAMAFKYFADQKVDIAVIEVGLGGRLDCTNIITPLLSLITTIGLDHTQMLGSTLADIAREKAGIIKPGVPVVYGEMPQEAATVIEATAKERGSLCVAASSYDFKGNVKPGDVSYSLHGDYQSYNLRTVLCAIETLQRHTTLFEGKDIAVATLRGLSCVGALTGLTGRWQTLKREPLVVCDVGHNPQAWQSLAPQIRRQPQAEKHLIIGMMADKDVSSVLRLMQSEDIHYHFCAASSPRALSAEALYEKAKALGFVRADHYPTVAEACREVIGRAKADDFVFIGGSCYVVGEALEIFSPCQ